MKQKPETYPTFAAALAAFMEEHKIKTGSLAMAYACSDGYISQLKTGSVAPTWMVMQAICAAINTHKVIGNNNVEIVTNEAGIRFEKVKITVKS